MSVNVIKVLALGDLIGDPGVNSVILKLNSIKKKEKINLVIANGENSDNGFGITENIIEKLKQAGVDVITSGNHIWSNKDCEKLLSNYDILLRPANYPAAPGKGYWIGETGGVQIGVVNLQGRYSMTPIDCPFQVLGKLIKSELKNRFIIVDFHAESSAEKKTLTVAYDGKISLLFGTHTHVQTADEVILKGGTGFITDLGLCGGLDSVIGMDKDGVLEKISTQINVPFTPSKENVKIQGIIAEIDIKSGKCLSIKRISV